MAEIILCNQPTHINQLGALQGYSANDITGVSCVNPDILHSYTPYIANQDLSSVDHDIMHLLSPMPVARQLTNLSLSYGEDNTLALSAITAKLNAYNIGLLGASTSVYANRIGGFVGSVQIYQNALMQYRQAGSKS